MTLGIITVCYNSEKTISRTLKSIENQSVKPDELIIIDGGSSDGTLDIVQEFKSLPIKIISESDDGIYNAMNKGLKLCSSDVVGFLNSDDSFHDGSCVLRIRQSFEGNAKIIIFTSGVNYIKADDSITRKWRVAKADIDFSSGGHVPHPGFYFKRQLLTKLVEFNESYKIASDFDFMLRAFNLAHDDEVHIDQGVLVNMLEGGASNANFRNILRGNAEVRSSLKSNGYKVDFTHTFARLLKKFLQRIKNS
jgi:glycosyltransferase involved in cell wall biosynthesis